MFSKRGVRKMPLIKVKHNYQIPIPNSLRENLNIAVGDYLEAEKHNGDLVLKPVKMVHSNQAYFYTKEWQDGEAKADKDIKRGDVIGPFGNIADSLKAVK